MNQPSPKTARNHAIFAARAEGLTMLQIAKTYGISESRVQQILQSGSDGRTLTQLPGTEKLSSKTRGLLIRRGYRSAEAILADLAQGKLYPGCTAGIAAKRFDEIAAWAQALESSSNPAASRQHRQAA